MLPGPDARLWLFGVARRLYANHRRAAARRDRLHAALAVSFRQVEVPAGETLVVREALASLREEDREVLRLVSWEGLSPAELAPVLGCSPNAAAIRVHRARRRLATILEREAERSGSVRTGMDRKERDR